MSARKFFVRCYGERRDDQWVVVCLDFSLAAQADTFNEARALLDAQIRSYLRDALVGEDRKHASYLLNRRAPLHMWLRYYGVRVLLGIKGLFGYQKEQGQRPFRETIPLVPSPC